MDPVLAITLQNKIKEKKKKEEFAPEQQHS